MTTLMHSPDVTLQQDSGAPMCSPCRNVSGVFQTIVSQFFYD